MRVVSPEALPFSGVKNVTRYAAGGAFKRTLINNWYHTFTEDSANYAVRFCQGLGLCSYDDFHGPGKVHLAPVHALVL